MQWDDLRVFLAVQRSGSHKGGARQLGVDPTTVGRRLAALEREVGARLFMRTPERLELTPAGRTVVPRAERMEAEALELERELSGLDAQVEGSLRVTATDGVVQYVLLPALGELRRAHPLLALELRTETRNLDLSRREADVAVRLGRPKEASLVARRLGAMQLSLFASREYLSRRGTPRTLAGLGVHEFIGFDRELDDTPQNRWLRRAVPRPRYVLRTTTTTAQVRACAEGYGVALLPVFVAPHEPRLVRLFPKLVGPSRELFAVMHSDMQRNARCRVFVEWFGRVLADASP